MKKIKIFFKKHFLIFIGVSILWILFSIVIILASQGFNMSFPSLSQLSLIKLGMFGDSFNIITSLFTGLAFAGVIISIRLQKEELIKVSNEMVIQSFDNKFFQMLNLFHNIVENLYYKKEVDVDYPPFIKSIVYKKRGVIVEIKKEFEKESILDEVRFNIDSI